MMCRDILMFFFFFFQAEDGIRDLYVTGVQTCALPIYLVVSAVSSRPMPETADTTRSICGGGDPCSRSALVPTTMCDRSRSEERRVGKGRNRGWRRAMQKIKQSYDRRYQYRTASRTMRH